MGRVSKDGDLYCEKCHKTMGKNNFYTTNDLEKYPSGYLNQCKKCTTMHVDNFDPKTYIWILKELDVPYVPSEWDNLIIKANNQGLQLNTSSILGKYAAKMKLRQWNKYRFKDTDYIQEVKNKQIRESMVDQGFTEQQIDEQLKKACITISPEDLVEPQNLPDVEHPQTKAKKAAKEHEFWKEADSAEEDSEIEKDINNSLTKEEKIALRVKWGKTYTPDEWIRLEDLYNAMMKSYDIRSAGHIDTLKLICKASLKANQLMDIGDIDGAQKATKMYDSLMKSGRFTAAQIKQESGEYVDSVSELVALCEKDGFIPRFYSEQPNDCVDRTIQDIQSYTKRLITEETNLGELIENAVKQIKVDEEAEKRSDTPLDEDELFEEELFSNEDYISAEDLAQYKDFDDEQAAADEESLSKAVKEDNK